jgi:hypothetical protein
MPKPERVVSVVGEINQALVDRLTEQILKWLQPLAWVSTPG